MLESAASGSILLHGDPPGSTPITGTLSGVPQEISVPMLERTYSQHILDHSDTVARRALLDTAKPAAGNIVSLPARSS